jgi:hypothetical protein
MSTESDSIRVGDRVSWGGAFRQFGYVAYVVPTVDRVVKEYTVTRDSDRVRVAVSPRVITAERG